MPVTGNLSAAAVKPRLVIRTNVMKNNSDGRLVLHCSGETLSLLASVVTPTCRVSQGFDLGEGNVFPDLHVVALIYRLQPSDRVSCANPTPLLLEHAPTGSGAD